MEGDIKSAKETYDKQRNFLQAKIDTLEGELESQKRELEKIETLEGKGNDVAVCGDGNGSRDGVVLTEGDRAEEEDQVRKKFAS